MNRIIKFATLLGLLSIIIYMIAFFLLRNPIFLTEDALSSPGARQALLGNVDAPRLVIGAHYDVHYDNPGADDNASGVAGILELSRLLFEANPQLEYRVDIVAYTLEELPNFRSQNMGSYVHAVSLRESGVDVLGMLAVEMIGYFSQERGSQSFPIPGMDLLYSDVGDFIALVGKMGERGYIRDLKSAFKTSSMMPIYSINAPRRLNGIDFSDHLSYWDIGYKAAMITDTSFLRNPHYHRTTDTIETLHFERMSEVVNGMYGIVVGLK